MGGMDFLNKKCWHTGTIQNIEKVWIAEQKEADKLRKAEERRKIVAEERQREELRKLQVKSGVLQESDAIKMGWMYNDPLAQVKQQEEFLLGKQKTVDRKDEDVVKLQESKTAAGSLFLQDMQRTDNLSVLDQEAKIRNDPLTEIMRREQNARKDVLKNPLQMRKIREDLKLAKKLKKHKKRMAKEAKRAAKKAAKKAAKHSKDSSSSDGHKRSRKHRSHSSSRSASPRRHDRTSSPKRQGRHDSRRASRSRSRSQSRENVQSSFQGGHGTNAIAARLGKKFGLLHPKGLAAAVHTWSGADNNNKHHSDTGDSKHARQARSKSPPKSPQRSRRHRSVSRSPTRRRRDRSRSRSRSRRRHREDRHDRPRSRRDGGRGSDRRDSSTSSSSRRRHDNDSRSSRGSAVTSKMSQEERQRRIDEMQRNAKKHSKRAKKRLEKDQAQEEEENRALKDSRRAEEGHKASFINDLNNRAYVDHNDDLEDRLGKNKHYRQKGNMDRHSFI